MVRAVSDVEWAAAAVRAMLCRLLVAIEIGRMLFNPEDE